MQGRPVYLEREIIVPIIVHAHCVNPDSTWQAQHRLTNASRPLRLKRLPAFGEASFRRHFWPLSDVFSIAGLKYLPLAFVSSIFILSEDIHAA
jgi:hypothetical protein